MALPVLGHVAHRPFRHTFKAREPPVFGLPGQWIGTLREVARAIRAELLELSSSLERPRRAAEAEEVGKRADELVTSVLLKELHARDVACTLVCEDLGVMRLGPSGGEGPYLLVDPLDGTRNFARGLPVASISMAVCSGPDLRGLREALVLEVFSGREFWAISGEGAFSGQKRLSVSGTADLSKALVSVDKSRLSGEPEWVSVVASSVGATRQLGSAALELCFLASGITDAHVDLRGRIRPTDVAAGLLIALEAGASVWLRGKLRLGGALDTRERLFIIASSPGLFGVLMELLKPYLGVGLTLGR